MSEEQDKDPNKEKPGFWNEVARTEVTLGKENSGEVCFFLSFFVVLLLP